MSRFKSLSELLYRHSPEVLAAAVEQKGIYYKNALGTIKLTKDDGDAWQCRRDPLHLRKIIFHTEDESTASRTTKSRALAVLEKYADIYDIPGMLQDPMLENYRLELRSFGWPENVELEFDSPTRQQVTLTAPDSKHENQSAPEIIPMKEPQSKDDWFLIIRAAIDEFEKENGKTPSREELWMTLIQSPPEGWGIDYIERQKHLTRPSYNTLDRSAFNKRYKRYYPNNTDH